MIAQQKGFSSFSFFQGRDPELRIKSMLHLFQALVFFCVDVLLACMCVGMYVCMSVPKEVRRGCYRPLETRVSGGYELPCGCQKLNLNPLPEQQVLVITELTPKNLYFKGGTLWLHELHLETPLGS